MSIVQIGQNRSAISPLLALVCLFLSSSGRADVNKHLTNPQQGSTATTDPNDTGTTSNHPAGTPSAPTAGATERNLVAVTPGSIVAGPPQELPLFWLIVTGALSLTALGMGGHLITREDPVKRAARA